MHSTTEAGIAETAAGAVARSLYGALKSVPDKRHRLGRRFDTGLLLTWLLLAKLAGESAMAAIAHWARERQPLLAQ